MKKIIRLEILKILLSFAIAVLIYLVLYFGFDGFLFGINTVDIHFHDTYLLIVPLHFWLTLLLIGHFLINTFYSIYSKYFSHFANSIYLLELFVVYYFLEFIRNFWSTVSEGFTSYPPLSALEIEQPAVSPQPIFSFSLLFIPFGIYALIFCFRWVRWANNI